MSDNPAHNATNGNSEDGKTYPAVAYLFREGAAPPGLSISEYEGVLADWFEHPVILCSSGRGAIRLFLEHRQLHRYRHHIVVPKYLSLCVLNAMTAYGFPVEATTTAVADAALYYHQYGISQVPPPQGPNIVEDICHGFFGGPATGRREWHGEVAAFSLPKFFLTNGACGGLVALDHADEEPLRQLLDAHSAFPADIRNVARQTLRAYADSQLSFRSRQLAKPFDLPVPGDIEGNLVSIAYEAMIQDIGPSRLDVAGLPETRAELEAVGEARKLRTDYYFANLDAGVTGVDLVPGIEDMMLYNLPFFASDDVLAYACAALRELGIKTDVYHLDIARDAWRPQFRRCLLVPANQTMSESLIEDICRTLGDCAASEKPRQACHT